MRTDDILNQIDTALHAYDVSGDAMRSVPASSTPAPAARSVLVQRLVERHGLEPEDAVAAVLVAEQGRTSEHTDLVQAEVRAAANEMAQTIRTAFRPMAEAATAAMKSISEAFKLLQTCDFHPHSPARLRDRPAWQSPYGPATRRR